MKKSLLPLLALVMACVLVHSTFAGDLKSGPQVGQAVPGPFHPLNCNGEGAGQKVCLYCQNGQNPVALVFARKKTKEVVQLIKKIEKTTEKNQKARMGSFVVFLNDSEKLEGELKSLAKQLKLKHCILSIDNPTGPTRYKVAKDADVTVVLYTQHRVKANYAFKNGELTEKAIQSILKDVPKILK